jgi:hypothetical protein
MYNYTNFSNASNFDIRQPPTKFQNAGGIRGSIGGPMTSSVMNPNGLNKGFASETNVSVKANVRTRTRDQKFINQHQLAFIYTKNYDKPILFSLQQVNTLLAGGSPLTEGADKKMFGKSNPSTWSKDEILRHLKLFGSVVNRDTDTNDSMPIDRVARTFTMCVRGDCHILDYWSHDNNRLKKYDICYFLLKRIWVSKSHKYQSNLTIRSQNSGDPALDIGEGRYCWQIIPYSTRNRSIDPSVYTTTIYTTPVEITKQNKKDKMIGGVEIKGPSENHHEVTGSYWRVGYVHEYASIGNPSTFKTRDELSVSRDIAYLTNDGGVRPMQFYLFLDDETKLI